MEVASIWVLVSTIVCVVGFEVLKWILKSVNRWLYENRLGAVKYALPPGDLGWPFIGNMWSFLIAFKSNDPDSFMRNYATRYGKSAIYKAFMFGNPSVVVTTPEACKRVLTDDDAFQSGWPKATIDLIGKYSFAGITYEEHKRLRKLTAASINGHEALSVYLNYIEDNIVSALDEWSKMGQFEFLTHLRKLTFKIIVHIFLSSESEHAMEALEREYTILNHGIRAMAINLPGFAYYKALKARKNLVAVLQSIVNGRRNQSKSFDSSMKKDMLDALLHTEDENGRKLSDEEIIDVLLMYLNAGHESSGHITMWATVLLHQHPEFLQKAKQEQEEIIKKRPPSVTRLTLKEIRDMNYLSKVIDETLRLVTFSFAVFRQAKTDVNISGYVIPKDWKVIVWFRSVHNNPDIYPNPQEFNPSRWDNYTAKAGTFLPFGAGSRMCPGNGLAKLEITVFLYHFILNYEFERLNPGCSLMHLPHPRPKDNCLARIKKISTPVHGNS